jgi:hypothetical protein
VSASLLDVIVIAVYLVGITAFGIRVGYRRDASTDHYFLANKSLGWFTVGAAVFTSNISTIHLVGLAAGGAKEGMVIGNFEWMACFTLILLAGCLPSTSARGPRCPSSGSGATARPRTFLASSARRGPAHPHRQPFAAAKLPESSGCRWSPPSSLAVHRDLHGARRAQGGGDH